MQKMTTCLWFDSQAEEAAKFYTSIFEDSKLGPILRWGLRRADALIAVSEFVARTLAAAGFDRRRIHIALNAIDPSLWRPGVGRGGALVGQFLGCVGDLPGPGPPRSR